MNEKPELEDLIAAARRTLADQKRQQELSSLIDQWEAAATPSRRPLWVYTGVAASILLIVSISLHFLFQENTLVQQQEPLVAEMHPKVIPDTCSAKVTETVVATTLKSSVQHSEPLLLSENEVTLTDRSTQSESADQSDFSDESTLFDNPLLTEDIVAPAVVHPDKPKVHERVSTRLICGSGCKPEPKSDANGDSPQYAILNITGTSTSFELGNISF